MAFPQIMVAARLRSELSAAVDTPLPTIRAHIEILAGHDGARFYRGKNLQTPSNNEGAGFDQLYPQFCVAALYYRVNPGDNPGKLIATGYPEANSSFGEPIKVEATMHNGFSVLFPLGQPLVALLEDYRAGRDATFGMKVKATFLGRANVKPAPFIEPTYVHVLDVEDVNGADGISVAKSTWVERVLPGLRLGKFRIYEMSLSELKPLEEADKHLGEAQRHFDTGEWRAAVASSRIVLQELRPLLKASISDAFSDGPSSKDPSPAPEKADGLMMAYGNLAEAMRKFQAEAFGLLSTGAHSLPPDAQFERPDAEFALSLALSCRRYVGLRMRAPGDHTKS
jgi:hypothetical protein